MNILQESNISHLQTLLRAPSHKVSMWRQRRRRRGLQVPTEGRPLPPLSLPWVPVSCPQRCHCGAHEDRLAQRLANTGNQLGPGQGRLKQSNTLYCYPFLWKQLHTLACGIDNLAAEISEGVEGDSCVSCRPVKLPRRLLV